jgi:hypothetical protein
LYWRPSEASVFQHRDATLKCQSNRWIAKPKKVKKFDSSILDIRKINARHWIKIIIKNMPDRPDLHNDDKPDYLCDLQNSSAIHVKLEVGISQGNRNFGKEGMLTGTVKAILRESECLVKRSTASKGS